MKKMILKIFVMQKSMIIQKLVNKYIILLIISIKKLLYLYISISLFFLYVYMFVCLLDKNIPNK